MKELADLQTWQERASRPARSGVIEDALVEVEDWSDDDPWEKRCARGGVSWLVVEVFVGGSLERLRSC